MMFTDVLHEESADNAESMSKAYPLSANTENPRRWKGY
jgi:hypothetical protein